MLQRNLELKKMLAKRILCACNRHNCKSISYVLQKSDVVSKKLSVIMVNPPPLRYVSSKSCSVPPPDCNKPCADEFNEECVKIVNEQIAAELEACYSYLAMASYFGRSEVSLPGCYAFFFQMHLEELGHAHNLMRYQNMRGGKVKFCPLSQASEMDWNILKSLEKGLELEKSVKEKLVKVANVAEKNKDYSLADFIVTEYIQNQEKSIQEYLRWIHRYKNMTCGQCPCSDYLFDRELFNEYSKAKNEEELKLTSDEKAYK